MESLNQSFGIQMHEFASTSSSPTTLAHENIPILQSSEESQEIHRLKHEVAVWKTSHNENLKAMAILEHKNSELHHMLQNDIQKLRNEIAQFENETLQQQKLKEIQMLETSQKQELKSCDEDAEHMKQIIADLIATVDKQCETISDMEKKHEADRECFDDVTKFLESDIAALELKNDGEKKTFEAKIVEMEQQIAVLQAINKNLLNTGNKVDNAPLPEAIKSIVNNNGTQQIEYEEPLVIKKFVKLKAGTSWNAFFTLDENERPLKIRYENNDLFLNNVKSSKKLILDGAVTFCDDDPFEGKANFVKSNAAVFPGLLLHVQVWNITDLFLNDKYLALNAFENIFASGTIKNLYFTNVYIIDTGFNDLVQMEDIMEKLPNIEKFRFDVYGTINLNISKSTSKNLVKLPCFKNLQIFQLFNIVFEEFDADDFLDFMKKHPAAKFTLSFRPTTWLRKGYVMGLKNRMIKSCPTPKNLTFK